MEEDPNNPIFAMMKDMMPQGGQGQGQGQGEQNNHIQPNMNPEEYPQECKNN